MADDTDEVLDKAILETLEASRYNMSVPEEMERFVYNTHCRVPDKRIERVRAAIRQYFAKPPAEDVEAAVPSGEDDIDAEVDRVLDEVTRKLKLSLQNESYLEESDPTTNEWYVTVRTRYRATAAQAVEEEVREAFARRHCNMHRRRPFYRRLICYNIHGPLDKEPKDVFLVIFFFQFIQDPRTVPHNTPPAAMQK